MNLKDKLSKIILLTIVAVCLGAYFLVEPFRAWINEIVVLFSTGGVEGVAAFIRSYGIYAVAVSFFLMVFTAIAAPLPAFLITFSNAAIFGWWQGAILSWSSAMVGAVVCFYIARIAGRDVVEKLTSKFAMESIDEYFERYGRHTILICRLLPFVSFDFVSYAAGLTAMGFVPFFIATGIGQLPATIVYSYVGGMLTGGVKIAVTAILIISALFILVSLAKKIYNDKHKTQEVK
ncbi:MAG: TVP38/TMEM64 family protein [Firmicutes bacterium]|nr:TVP38/TMEM64 family protein [Bacillota bacterium]MBQ6900454.1 TVP38/TMEM64 family protein [Bacillota bacterium]MBR1990254.1 TVP38/TMEM64 family protein [Bacillota bacterium]MBR3706515.1 TVP38/TMEM64 family protein [Bacillota bacterium]